MDFTSVIAQVWGTLGWFIALMLLIGLLKSPWAKGLIGELLVRLFAHWQRDKQTYRRLYNVTLNTPEGTTQIDHVVLSPYCIFVLGTKNMSGWILGSKKLPHWAQKHYKKRTFKSHSPQQNNYKYLKAMEATLSINPEYARSATAFVSDIFKTEVPTNMAKGIGFIRDINSFQKRVFKTAEVDAMLHTLKTGLHMPTLAPHRERLQKLRLRSDSTARHVAGRCWFAQ